MIFAVIVTLFVAGVVGVTVVSAEASPGTLLGRARSYVHDHATARFQGTTTVNAGDPLSPVSEAHTDLAQISGEVQQHRTHATLFDDTSAAELVLVGRAAYARVADTPESLDKAPYVRADEQARRLMRVRAEQARALDVGAVLAAASDAKKLTERKELTVIETDVDAKALFGRDLGAHVSFATARLFVTDDGELRAMRLVTRGEATITYRLQYADWGSRDIRIAAPPSTQIDNSPAIAAAKLAAFKTAPLLMPNALPAGWELVRADVLVAADTQEGCAQAELAYEDRHHAKGGYLYLYEFPRNCAKTPASDATPFTAGNYTGFAAVQDAPYVQITAGQTTVQAVSDLSLDELAQTLSGLVPLAIRSA